jgi:hypothetical protein
MADRPMRSTLSVQVGMSEKDLGDARTFSSAWEFFTERRVYDGCRACDTHRKITAV